jgi:diacylglycerol kinase
MDIKRLKNSFRYAWVGLKDNYEKEQNFRIQLLIGFLVLTLALVLNLNWLKLFALLITIAMVLSLEMMNSALERYIDILSPSKDKTIGLVKDVLAGAVLVAAIVSVIIGLVVFYQPMRDLFVLF